MKNLKHQAILILRITIGCVLVSLAINLLYIPNKMLGGGISGISMIVKLLFGFDTGLVYLLINLPIIILGFFALPRRFMFFTLYGMVAFSLSLSLTAMFHITTNNILSAILLGGTISGMGNGIVYGAGGCIGGTDIIGKFIQRKYSISISTVVFAFNVVVIGISMYFFGIDISVCTLAAMFISSRVSNFVIDGMNHKRMVFIISDDKQQELAEGILEQLGRGVTILNGEGGYTGMPKKIIYCIIGITQVAQLREVVRSIDESAFVTITETAQVYGNGKGFYNVKDEI